MRVRVEMRGYVDVEIDPGSYESAEDLIEAALDGDWDQQSETEWYDFDVDSDEIDRVKKVFEEEAV